MSDILAMENVAYAYSQQATTSAVPILRGLNLSLAEGDYVTITGESGIGKTTLLHLIAGLDMPDSGTIRFRDTVIDTTNKQFLATYRLHNIGLVFQDNNLIPSLTLFENIETPLGLQGMSRDLRKDRVHAILEMLHLDHRADHIPATLSGGERKRASIGRAIVNHPDILLVDEPIAGLDRTNADNILAILRKFHQDGTTILSTTHREQAQQQSTARYELRDGILFNLE